MFLLHLTAGANSRLSALRYSEHRSTGAAFAFFAVTFACIFLLYSVEIYLKTQSLPHAVVHVPEILVGDLGAISILATAIAYSRGREFDLGATLGWIAKFMAFVFLWAVAFELLGHDRNKFLTVLEVSPDIIAAALGVIALGWVVYVRWGGVIGEGFFLLAIAYALLQVPANLVLSGFAPLAGSGLELTFPILAGGKILLAFGFLALLCGSTQPELNIDEPKYWPSGAVPVPNWLPRMWQVTGGFVTAIVVTVVADSVARMLNLPGSHR